MKKLLFNFFHFSHLRARPAIDRVGLGVFCAFSLQLNDQFWAVRWADSHLEKFRPDTWHWPALAGANGRSLVSVVPRQYGRVLQLQLRFVQGLVLALQ